jgi:hypothetical protein
MQPQYGLTGVLIADLLDEPARPKIVQPARTAMPETDPHWLDGVLRLILVVCIAAVAIISIYLANDRHKWENWCHSAGGHITEKVTGAMPNYNPMGGGAVPTKTSYCFTSDGRLLGTRQT